MNLGNRIKEIREKQKKTRNDLSKLLKLSPASIYLIEAGKNLPTPKSLAAFCCIFGVSADYIAFGKEDSKDVSYQKLNKEEQIKEKIAGFGSRYREMRKKTGLSLKDFAEKVRVSTSFIYHIENNNTIPATNALINTCELLNLSLDHLLLGRNPKTAKETTNEQQINNVVAKKEKEDRKASRQKNQKQKSTKEIVKPKRTRKPIEAEEKVKLVSLGQKLKEIRQKAKISVDEASKRAGISKGHLYNLENGQTKPSEALIKKICEICKVNPNKISIELPKDNVKEKKPIVIDVKVDKEETVPTVGEKLKNIRLKSALKLSEFSKKLGISDSHLSKLEKNIGKPSKKIIEKVSEVFNVSKEYFIGNKTDDRVESTQIQNDTLPNNLDKYTLKRLVGQRIKELRVKAKMSYAELARRVDVTESFIHHIERGRRIPKIDLIDKISKVFTVHPDFLLLDKIKEAAMEKTKKIKETFSGNDHIQKLEMKHKEEKIKYLEQLHQAQQELIKAKDETIKLMEKLLKENKEQTSKKRS